MTELRLLKHLPKKERESIEDHANRIPHSWNPATLPRIKIPARRPWYDQPRPGPGYEGVPSQIEYVEFELMRVARGEPPFGAEMTALVANGNVIVQLWD